MTMDPIPATIDSEAINSAYREKERAAMRRVALVSRPFSTWVRGAIITNTPAFPFTSAGTASAEKPFTERKRPRVNRDLP